MVDGHISTANLGEFKIPTSYGCPQVNHRPDRESHGAAPFKDKAIADAIGVRLFELPLTAEKIYWALKQTQD